MKNRKPGYTLLELMIVVVLIGIVTAVAAPQISDGMANNTVSNATNEISVAFRYARTTAAQYGRAMRVFIHKNGGNSIVRVDRSADNLCSNFPTCDNTDIPSFGGPDCGLRFILFDRGPYPRHRVEMLGMAGPTTNPAEVCITPIGRVMLESGGRWRRSPTIEIGLHRTNSAGDSIGVVRAVTVSTLGIPRAGLSRHDAF